MEKCDDGWFVGECDTCLSAELFEMSSFAECLEVAFICEVKMVKKFDSNFSKISHLFPPRTLKLGCRGVELCFPC